ncbi:hypothetical protein NE236_41350 [Actinoallomurus purpureus]|uniref:hypothetical protein n=1 Tax=Actinoallomurus purpureus TaxID=478114 RepID=UPI00209241AB|nr:hypothetical protein [Actinoallomurus purpureus]MCO6011416.1 hypothetical protein [Actinoallomurus purpureus]
MPKFTIDYQPDIRGTNELMNSPEMLALVTAAAEKGKEHAISISPRRTGTYAGSFRVEANVKGGPRHDRAEARLVNDSGHAADVEFKNRGGERVLGRTVDYIEEHGGA